MSTLLQGENAVVTGAGRGIGRQVALALARHGAKVVVNDVGASLAGVGSDNKPADSVVNEIRKEGGIAVANYESVADFSSAYRIIDTCVKQFGKLDILVNMAGIIRLAPLCQMNEEDWDAMIAVHLKGTFNCCRHACSLMNEQKKGRIINTTSDAWRGFLATAGYSAAKAGIVGLTRALAREELKYGVTCNAIAPIAVTRFAEEQVLRGIKQSYEAGHMTKSQYNLFAQAFGPEYIPPIVVYLASKEAANITGKVFGCSGTRIALYSEPIEVKTIFKAEGIWTLDELQKAMPMTVDEV
jgi:NAD(P)-dependent dehydrogenase (short-subunit alcohol dehydrogenase family)